MNAASRWLLPLLNTSKHRRVMVLVESDLYWNSTAGTAGTGWQQSGLGPSVLWGGCNSRV